MTDEPHGGRRYISPADQPYSHGGKFPLDPLELGIHDDEPYFVIRAADLLSPQALALYAELARKLGLDEHAQGVEARAVQFMRWQAAHRELVKSPD